MGKDSGQPLAALRKRPATAAGAAAAGATQEEADAGATQPRASSDDIEDAAYEAPLARERPASAAVVTKPAAQKIEKWVGSMEDMLLKKRTWPRGADELSGRLAWSTSFMFHRFGRALLRPIYDQKSRLDGTQSPELRRALRW